mgnify:FL=1|jgi:predicted CopG family antitoxin
MASINICIKQEAYDLLSSLKGKDKSFSDVIIEVVSERKKGNSEEVMKLWGCLKEKGDDYWDGRKKDYKRIRKELNYELDNRGRK